MIVSISVVISVFELLASVAAVGAGIEIIFANPNQKITLPCDFNQKADKLRWYFQRSAAHEEAFAYDLKLMAYDGYLGNCSLEKQYCHLIIHNATTQFAGKYRLEHGINGKERVQSCAFELVLGAMECHSNIRNNHIMIGKSDDPVKSDVLRRICEFKYQGNYWGPFAIAWMKNKMPLKISRDRLFNQTSIKDEGEWKVASVEDEIDVSSDDHETRFECVLVKQPLVHSCQLPRIFVQYVRNITLEPQHVNINNFPGLNCSIDKSESLDCSYQWTLRNQELDLKVHQQHLTSLHVVTPGLYSCSATCTFITGESYVMSGTQVIVVGGMVGGYVVAVIWSVLASLLLVAMVLVYISFWRYSSKPTHTKDQLLGCFKSRTNPKDQNEREGWCSETNR